MKTEYAKPGVFFGIEFGKPVRLPQIKKNVMLSNRENSENKNAEYSLEKYKENIKNKTNAFQLTQNKKIQATGVLPKLSNQSIEEEPIQLDRVRSERQFHGQIKNDIVATYRIGAIIGKGSYSIVRMVRNWKGGVYAMKTYEKINEYDNFKRKNIKNEIQILEMISHPQVLKYVESLTTATSIHIITELIDNRSLKDYVKDKPNKAVSQNQAKQIMRDLLEVLKYLHKLNISHRDIKMENILITKSGKIKLIDFGFSVKNDQLYYDFCGTPNYMSPEIISKGGYLGHKGDIWAAGILFYKLATGNFPFKGMNDKIIYRKICRGEYRVQDIPSVDMQRIIRRMLEMDYSQRASAKQLLQDQWFQN